MKAKKKIILQIGKNLCSLALVLIMMICIIPQMTVKADNVGTTEEKLEEDWGAMSSAAGKMNMTNTTTKAQVMKVITAAAKNGTKAEWKSFRKVDATYESKGGVTAYLNLSLDGKTRELYINEVIPTLGNNRPEKGIAVSEDEWNILRENYQYLGVGTYETEAVQIFASSNKKIKSYTTSTGKTTFADEEAMAGEYLICTDQAGVKSYLPLDTTYMKKVKGGYTINLNATKTVKIKIKNASSTSSYTDVDAADAKAVAWVVKNKIMEPTSKNEFYSKAICTKGDVFNALYKANGSPTPKALNHFPDVKSTDSYYKAALWAVDKGLIEYGIFEGKYAYQRGYALYYVWQSIGAPKASQKSTFTDYKDWVFYADAVAWAESKGIIKDNGDHKFRPDDAVTRVELAKFIYYAYK